jgi:hypothetical protein
MVCRWSLLINTSAGCLLPILTFEECEQDLVRRRLAIYHFQGGTHRAFVSSDRHRQISFNEQNHASDGLESFRTSELVEREAEHQS